MCSSPVFQPLTPVTPTSSISTITVGILSPARVLAEDLMKATLKEGSPNLLKVALKCIGRKATSESTSSCGADIEVDPRTTQHHPQGWVHQLHAPAHLAPVAA